MNELKSLPVRGLCVSVQMPHGLDTLDSVSQHRSPLALAQHPGHNLQLQTNPPGPVSAVHQTKPLPS